MVQNPKMEKYYYRSCFKKKIFSVTLFKNHFMVHHFWKTSLDVRKASLKISHRHWLGFFYENLFDDLAWFASHKIA